MNKTELSIVIVSWSSWEFLSACLDSVFHQDDLHFEVILVDNNSQDGTVEKVTKLFPPVKLVANTKNLGYARACNQGIKETSGEFILLLNPDTLVHKDSLLKIVKYIKRDGQMGALGPQLLNPDGSIQPSCRRFPDYLTLVWEFTGLSRLFPSHPLFGSWRMGDFDFNTIREVDQPMGAALLIRKEVIERAGGMDERFKMFFNEVDLCYRIKKSNYKIVFYPEAKITHYRGASTSKKRPLMILYSHLGFFRYLQKHHGSGFRLVLLVILSLGLLVSGGVRIFHTLLKKSFRK